MRWRRSDNRRLDSRERGYFHRAHSLAFRTGVRILEQGDALFIEMDGTRKLLCAPSRPGKRWSEAYETLKRMFAPLAVDA
jgi:hypothetical protein